METKKIKKENRELLELISLVNNIPVNNDTFKGNVNIEHIKNIKKYSFKVGDESVKVFSTIDELKSIISEILGINV